LKILITGINGFVGSHFIEFLLENYSVHEIHGTVRRDSSLKNIRHLLSKITLHECDLTDSHSVQALFHKNQFDRCFHLAGQSHVPTSWNRPVETWNANANGTLNLLEGIRHFNKNCRVLVCGSSKEYGQVERSEIPIREENPLRPMSPYAVSKVAADEIAYAYSKFYGLYVIRTRAFNQEGFRRSEDFVLGKITKQAVEIEQRKREFFELGNLDSKMDVTDVRDVVNAYWLILEKGISGDVYNVCSGKNYTVRELLDRTSKIMKISEKVKQDPRFLSSSDAPFPMGDFSKMAKVTGWKCRFEIGETIQDMIHYWRAELKGQPVEIVSK